MVNKYDTYTDEQLLEDVSKGDKDSGDAFREVYSRYSRNIMAYARLQAYNPELAADAFQEAWIGLYRTVSSGKKVGNISAILITIIRRRIADDIRNRKSTPVHLPLEDVDEIADKDRNDDTGTPAIDEALASLPPKYREPIILCKINGMKYAEIAELLGESQECIKKRIHRGINMLRDAIKQLNRYDHE